MATYRELTGVGVPTRAAAVLVGVARATATRKPAHLRLPEVRDCSRTIVPKVEFLEI